MGAAKRTFTALASGPLVPLVSEVVNELLGCGGKRTFTTSLAGPWVAFQLIDRAVDTSYSKPGVVGLPIAE